MENLANKEKILEYAKANQLFRSKDLAYMEGARTYIARLVEKGDLIRVGRGLYSLPSKDFSEWQTFLETARLVPQGVICLLSALRFHELTTQNPFEVWLAIKKSSREPKIDTIALNISRFSGKAFSEGIETHEIEGVSLQVYNPAKTVADCFKFRSKVGLDTAIEALRDTWRKKKSGMDELWHFAKVCRMSNVMRPYLESLV